MTLAPPCSFADLLVFLPYHVGFRLIDALVVVALDGARVDLVERVDIPPRGVLDPECIARMLLGVSNRRASSLLVVAYADDLDPEPALAHLVGAMADTFGGDPEIARVAVVGRDRWREPPHGPWQDLPDPADVPIVAEYVGRGVSPLPDRHALVAALAPDPLLVRAAATAAGRLRPTPVEGLLAWERLVAGESRESGGEDLFTTLAFVGHVRGRDALLSRLVPLGVADDGLYGRCDGGEGDHTRHVDPLARRSAVRAALIRLVRASPPGWRAITLTILGAWAWDAGDGALASVATALALQEDPSCTLAGVVARLVQFDIRPRCEV